VLIELHNFHTKRPEYIQSEEIARISSEGTANPRTFVYLKGNTAPVEILESQEQVLAFACMSHIRQLQSIEESNKMFEMGKPVYKVIRYRIQNGESIQAYEF
jgi:hypothetical protein